MGKRKFVFQDLESRKALQFTDDWKETLKRINVSEERQPDLSAYAGDYWSSGLETYLRIHLRDGQLVLELHRHGEFPCATWAGISCTAPAVNIGGLNSNSNGIPREAVTGLRLNSLLFRRCLLE